MALSVQVNEIVENSSNPLLSIAPNWKRVLVGDIAEILNGYAFESSLFSSEKGFPLLRIRDVGADKTECHYQGQYENEYIVRAGDLLIGMDGDFKSARWRGQDALLNQRVCKISLKTKNYEEKFLDFVLQPYLNAINRLTSSVTVKHLSSRTIAEIPLPLPPLNEQKRIVAKIEELFSELDEGIAALKKAQTELKRYRNAVLKVAFSSSSKRGQIKDVSSFIGSGITPKGGDQNYLTKGIPFIRSQNVYPFKFVDDGLAYVNQELHEQMARTHTQPNDVLLNITGASIGRCTILPDKFSKANVNQHVCIIRTNELVLPKFLSAFLNSPLGQNQIMSYQSGATRQGLNYQQLRKIELPIPEIKEQEKIVQDIEFSFSSSEKTEQILNKVILESHRLRQSILKKAFEGKLVSQDPSDEPAEILLEKIKHEKVKLQLEEKSKKRKR